jgi:type III secretion protein L
MAILRSRALAAEAHQVEYPALAQAHAALDARLVDARTAGIAVGRQERQAEVDDAGQRMRAAEDRARAAEEAAQAAVRRADEAEAAARAAVLAEVEQGIGTCLAALAAAAERTGNLEKQLVQQAEADVVALAGRIAARLLRREIEDDPTWLDPVLREALCQVPDKRGIAVRMHPEDAATARDRRKLITADIPGLDRLEIFDDANLERGACILASQGTRLDAGVPGAWERLLRDLSEELPSQPLAVASSDPVEPVP